MSDKLDKCVRVYNSGDKVVEERSGQETLVWLGYNLMFRPGCAAFVNDVCYSVGILERERAIAIATGVAAPAPVVAAPEWAEDDIRDDFSDTEDALFPTRTGRYECHALAMRLVGNRRSKGALVAMTNALLEQIDAARDEAAADKRDAERLRGLVRLAGHFGDGSFETITIAGDDALRLWYVTIGVKQTEGKESIASAIDCAIAREKP